MAARSETLQLIITAKELASGEVRKLNSAFSTMHGNVKGMLGSLFNLKSAFVGLGAGLLAKEFTQVGFTVDRMNTAMRASTGSTEAAASEFKFLREESERLGLVFQDQISNHQKLTAAARGTKMEGQATRDIFTAIAEAGTALQLSGENVNGTFYAVTQMMSKGKIQAEELRGQLGERIPGALNIAARAMGVTQEQLSKLLDEGKLYSEDFLPKFAAELHRTYGQAAVEASGKATASMNRLQNAWFEFRSEVMENGLFAYIEVGLKAASDKIEDLKKSGKLGEWARETAEAVIKAFESMVLGAARFYDTAAPILHGFKSVLGSTWKVFTELPEWVQETGIVLAFVGGRKVAVALAGLLHLYDAARNITQALQLLSEGKLSWEEFAMMNFDDLQKYLEGLNQGAATLKDQAAPRIEDFWKSFEGAGSATERARLLIQYMRQLREELAARPPAAALPSPSSVTGTPELSKEELHKFTQYANQYYEASMKSAKRQFDMASDLLSTEGEAYKYREEREKMFADLKIRLMRGASDDLANQHAVELAELDQRHAQEIERLKTFHATRAELDEAYRLQKQEKDQMLADQEYRLMQNRLQAASTVAGGMAEAFSAAYEATGKKHRGFYVAYKAAATAQAIIDTYSGAQAAYKAMAGIPYVGPALGVAAAAVAVASGLAKVAAIRAQQFAVGGLVKIGSGIRDDVPALLTKGEYVIRRQAVNAIGLANLDAANRTGGGVRRFADGGLVGGQRTEDRGQRAERVEITTVNFLDPAEFERFMATSRGQGAVLNVISSRAGTIKRILK